MELATQLDIVIPHVPGSLAKVCDCLRAADVNIEAMYATEDNPKSVLHLIVDDTDTAKIALRQFGEVKTKAVLAFKLKNTPGSVAYITRMCAGANINIRNVYSTVLGKEAMCYIEVDETEKAQKLLAKA